MKAMILAIVGVCGSAIAAAFGGWTSGLTTLVIFMAIDYITGLLVAGVFKRSPKTDQCERWWATIKPAAE